MSELSKWSWLLSVRMCQLLWRQSERTPIPSLGLIDVDRFCKDCQVQDLCEGVPRKTEPTKREHVDIDKKRKRRRRRKKKGWTIQTKTFQTKNDDRTRSSSMKTWLAGLWKSLSNVNTNTRVRGNTLRVDDEAVLQKCNPSFCLVDKLGYTSRSPEERQLAFALLRWEAQRKINTSPFLRCRRSSGWRRWQSHSWLFWLSLCSGWGELPSLSNESPGGHLRLHRFLVFKFLFKVVRFCLPLATRLIRGPTPNPNFLWRICAEQHSEPCPHAYVGKLHRHLCCRSLVHT